MTDSPLFAPTLYRARPAQLEVEGRTLEGIAVPLNRPARVRDGNGPTYREGFHARAFTRGLKMRADRPYPLGLLHPWQEGARTSPIPLGGVVFQAGPDALHFRAVVSKTMAGDEALELVRDRVLTDVSLGFRGLAGQQSTDRDGPFLLRTEVAIEELSLAPAGMGAHPGAEVLVVRTASEPVATPRLDALRRKLALLPRL